MDLRTRQAHPPNHPLQCIPLTEIHDPDHRKLYELVTRHFLACCGRDAQGNNTSIGIQIPLGGESFTANGLMVMSTGYLQVYGKYEKWNDNKVRIASHRVASQNVLLPRAP